MRGKPPMTQSEAAHRRGNVMWLLGASAVVVGYFLLGGMVTLPIGAYEVSCVKSLLTLGACAGACLGATPVLQNPAWGQHVLITCYVMLCALQSVVESLAEGGGDLDEDGMGAEDDIDDFAGDE